MRRPRVPIGLPIAAVILFILGAVAGPVIQARASEEALARNVLLSAIPFILIFVAIILVFVTLIWLVASALNHNISRQVYRPIELTLIGGIILGIVGMFQPWSFVLYRYGFYVLLLSTLAFILWSHVIPRGVQRQEHLGSTSITEYERRESGGGD
ncbi:MAG TPA: hypothetical protein VF177_05655 [Anaerolineae bacterium]